MSPGWRIWTSGTLGLPTVEDIVADLRSCGVATDPKNTNIFYSYGANNKKVVKNVINVNRFIQANPDLNAKSINHILPQSWYIALKEKYPGADSGGSMVQKAFNARNSQAYAKVSHDEVYVLIGGGVNIYTEPTVQATPGGENLRWVGRHNVWYDYEFRTLQMNQQVTAIYTVNAETLQVDRTPDGSWVRGRHGQNAAHHVDANTVTSTSLTRQKVAYLRAHPEECGNFENDWISQNQNWFSQDQWCSSFSSSFSFSSYPGQG
ncbi:hypothetical protein DM02DRAFT_669504 [Periconia macrospinosa]|uniref:Uncharacterized protein n=1 Tax=Periconia macrospinosa TaxID=97972 RepID=A0A2V1DZU1_9PLEO|nr:hypothetical protein DM02DRAFT_669504 [Periconia macrospinosa]